jgi:hypothetical protein
MRKENKLADKPSRGLADVSEYIGERGLTWVPVGQR